MAATLGAIFFSMILTNNYVLVKFLGICPFLGVSKRLDSAVGMSLAVTVVMAIATAVTWPLEQLLERFGLEYLQTIAFILVIATLVQLLETVFAEVYSARSACVAGSLPASDHHQLRGAGRDHPEH